MSSGYSGSSLMAYVCTATGRGQASVELKLIKIRLSMTVPGIAPEAIFDNASVSITRIISISTE